MVVAVRCHRRFEIGRSDLQRLIGGEVEEPREFPPRLIRPRLATRRAERRPDRDHEEAQKPGDRRKLQGVVTATGVMVWPGWVGVMNWFMMTLTAASCQVGQPPPHTSRAVESDDGASEGSANAAPGAVTAANPTPSAPPVLQHDRCILTYSSVSLNLSRRNHDQSFGSSSAKTNRRSAAA